MFGANSVVMLILMLAGTIWSDFIVIAHNGGSPLRICFAQFGAFPEKAKTLGMAYQQTLLATFRVGFSIISFFSGSLVTLAFMPIWAVHKGIAPWNNQV